MPIYEFKCPQGHVSEKIKPLGTTETVCMRCGQTARIIPSTTGHPKFKHPGISQPMRKVLL